MGSDPNVSAFGQMAHPPSKVTDAAVSITSAPLRRDV
jgi:hypothetical protein